jgi:hypothetical protein
MSDAEVEAEISQIELTNTTASFASVIGIVPIRPPNLHPHPDKPDIQTL